MPKRKNPRKPANRPKKSKLNNGNATPRPIARPPAARRPKSTAHHHVAAVCSITDPFCPASKSAKWPDGTAGNTLTEQFRGNLTISAAATGTSLYAFAAAAPIGIMYPLSAVGNTVTTSSTYSTYKASSLLETFGSEYRIVSFGVIIRCVASATTAAGLVTLGTIGDPLDISTPYTLGTELYDQVTIASVQPGMEVSWISQPRGAGAHTFVPVSTSTNVGSDWTNLVIELSGAAPSAPLLNVEWFMNIEFTVHAHKSISALAKSNPPAVPLATVAASHVHKSVGAFVEGGVAAVEKAVADAASNALKALTSDPLESLASLFGML